MLVERLDDIPEGTRAFFALVTTETRYIPGDQRSIDAPGHGYPAHQESFTKFEVFEAEEHFRTRIAEYEAPKFGDRKKYRALKIINVPVEVEVVIEI